MLAVLQSDALAFEGGSMTITGWIHMKTHGADISSKACIPFYIVNTRGWAAVDNAQFVVTVVRDRYTHDSRERPLNT